MRLIMHFGYDVTCNMSITKFCHFKKKCGYDACKLHFNILIVHAFWARLQRRLNCEIQVIIVLIKKWFLFYKMKGNSDYPFSFCIRLGRARFSSSDPELKSVIKPSLYHLVKSTIQNYLNFTGNSREYHNCANDVD